VRVEPTFDSVLPSHVASQERNPLPTPTTPILRRTIRHRSIVRDSTTPSTWSARPDGTSNNPDHAGRLNGGPIGFPPRYEPKPATTRNRPGSEPSPGGFSRLPGNHETHHRWVRRSQVRALVGHHYSRSAGRSAPGSPAFQGFRTPPAASAS